MAIRCLGFAILVLIASILILETCAQDECGDMTKINNQSRNFIEKEGPKIPPSEPCCEEMKGLDVSCSYKYVTPIIEDKISIEKALYVAETCHSQNIPTDKCGSYIIPPHSAPPKA
ncbi:hypothetical protein P8452_44862 [Trifolium repens]|nr:hypothetical protein QL285_029935 [Trifolium repens]WJX59553.1 hypothetical protein P8452_44862 [Trifolium repens]